MTLYYKNYSHVEDVRVKDFWESIFANLYGNVYSVEKSMWYENGHYKDVVEKIDYCVVLLPPTDKQWNYQLKTKKASCDLYEVVCDKDPLNLELDLNINTFNYYYLHRKELNVHGLGFGFFRYNVAIVFPFQQFCSLWIKAKDNWVKKYLENGDFLRVPMFEIDKYKIEYKVVWVKPYS